MVELGELARADSHQTAVIETHHKRLGSFGDELARHEAPGPSGCTPVDGAQVVAGMKVTMIQEFLPWPGKPGRMMAANQSRQGLLPMDRQPLEFFEKLSVE